jgi:hypothetical protein
MILVNEGTRGFVLSRTAVGEPCPHCGSEERDVVVQYQVFGFFNAFCASWGRRYTVECRQCRAVLAPLPIATFEAEHGNPIPYGHRFGLGVLAALIALTVAVFAAGVRNRAVTIVLLAVWAIVGLWCWRNSRGSTFRRRAGVPRAARS